MRQKTLVKHDAIRDAAAQAFAELGFERTSMSEISARVGGSKATLYSYFPSKEVLFVDATQAIVERLLSGVLNKLLEAREGHDVSAVLREFGVQSVLVLTSPEFAAVERMVIGEAGHSEIGRMFFESGPRQAMATISAYLAKEMKGGRLRRATPTYAAQHLLGLLDAESRHIRHFALPLPSKAMLRAGVRRAVDVFMAAYGVAASPKPKRAR